MIFVFLCNGVIRRIRCQVKRLKADQDDIEFMPKPDDEAGVIFHVGSVVKRTVELHIDTVGNCNGFGKNQGQI